MSRKSIQAVVSVSQDPVSVIRFVSDIRNRAKYQESLKSVTDIQGAPGEVTESWNWKWELFGNRFEGTGKTVESHDGQLYSFVTEGGITSRFTYRADRDGEGTRLFIDVEFDLPQVFEDHNDVDGLLTIVKVRAQEAALSLKALIESKQVTT